MADWEDSFAERMRNKALQRLQKNPHIMKLDSDLNGEPAFKKRNVPNNNVDSQNKENIDVVNNVNSKPVIAEHLTVRKSLSVDKMEVDEPEVFIMRTSKKKVFAEEECNTEATKEDVYVKHCKNRLANLAGKFKQFEEEDNHVPVRPLAVNNKQLTVKRRSNEELTNEDVSTNKNIRCEPTKSEPKQTHAEKQAHVFIKPSMVPKKPPTEAPKPTEKAILDKSVVKTLESQGYMRTVSDAHLFYDFKTVKDFDKENKKSSPQPTKVEKKTVVTSPLSNLAPKHPKESAMKAEKKEISNLYSNSKYQSNVFIQNARKINEQESNEETDPCLLSVAERRRLFEKRLAAAEVVETAIPEPISIFERKARTPVESAKSSKHHEYDSGNEYSTCESEDNSASVTTDADLASCSETPMTDEDVSDREFDNRASSSASEHHDGSNNEADTSVYPVLQTVKEVKFVSTPKPGCMYPSVSDLDTEVEEELNSSRHDVYKGSSHDDSFGRELLCATNSIFSSFQNSRKDNSDFRNKSESNNALSEARDLISPNDLSLTLSPTSSLHSVECANETASFTYLKGYSNISITSPVSVSDGSKNSIKQRQVFSRDEYDARIENDINDSETDVNQKIKFLEAQIIIEEKQWEQATDALEFCRSSTFLNSAAHLEAEKVLLLSQLRIDAARKEVDRIKVENSVQSCINCPNATRDNVIISDMKLPLKRMTVDFDLKENVCSNLMCVVKYDDTVLATEVVSVVSDKKMVEFPGIITVPNICSHFKIIVEVYNLVVERNSCHAGKQNQLKKDKKTPCSSKKDKKSRACVEAKRNPLPTSKRRQYSSFGAVGSMIFSLNEIQNHQWTLNRQTLYHSPLEGIILMKLECNLAKVRKHGFLTMYEMISGYGAWCRYWFYLNGETLSFWKYPEQETTQSPISSFNLKKCISKKVEFAGYDDTFRPQTFKLLFSPANYLQHVSPTLCGNRLLIAADNEEQREEWSVCLNKILKSSGNEINSNQ